MSNTEEKGPGVFRVAILVFGVLAISAVLSVMLMGMRKPPATADVLERSVRVDVVTAHLEDIPVMINGFGEARARDAVVISPEVSGRVIRIHPQLETGGMINAGDELFALDPRDYEARLADAEASVKQWQAALQRTEKQYETDKERLANYKRIAELARDDFDRAVKLYTKEQIESESFAGNKEATYKQAEDAYDLLRQSVDLYPLRVEEMRSSVTSATAAMEQAKLNLDRTVVRAPFNARVKEVSIEAGQWITIGSNATTLADDSMLEISVALNSADAKNWLLFDESTPTAGRAWFGQVKRVPVEIAWTEGIESNQWQGTLDRVAKFDEETRTITVVVRIQGTEASTPRAGNLPLVEGMFCRVRIPGQVAKGVVRLAAESVAFDQEASGRRSVFVAHRDPDSGRATLQTRSVQASHNDGDYVYISDGLKEGEQVIVTRLVNPLENTLLEVQELAAPETEAAAVPAGGS